MPKTQNWMKIDIAELSKQFGDKNISFPCKNNNNLEMTKNQTDKQLEIITINEKEGEVEYF